MLRDLVGIPYADKGRDPVTGTDCWGFLRYGYLVEYRIELRDLGDSYSTGRNRKEVAATVAAEIEANWRPVAEPGEGDAVLFNLSDRPFHCGMYLGSGEFIHNATPGQASCIERLTDLRWRNRIEGYYCHVRRCAA